MPAGGLLPRVRIELYLHDRDSPLPHRSAGPASPGAHLEALVHMLGQADWVVLCLPLTAETRGASHGALVYFPGGRC